LKVQVMEQEEEVRPVVEHRKPIQQKEVKKVKKPTMTKEDIIKKLMSL